MIGLIYLMSIRNIKTILKIVGLSLD